MKTIKKVKYSSLLVWILRKTFGVFLRKYYSISYIDPENIKDLEGPFLITANHVNFWDPFFISAYLPQKIHYVTSDNIFRDKIFGIFMRLFGSIPKSKFISDVQTIKLIFRVVEEQNCIGIFPEGRRTWDGDSFDPLPSLAKLAKKLSIPIIHAYLKGGFLALPRWARKKRNGPVNIEFRTILTVKQLNELSVEEIQTIIEKELKYSEIEQQQNNPRKYTGKYLAEYLEQFLFICPDCFSISTLHSDNSRFKCLHCGYEVQYTEYGDFNLITGNKYFQNPRDWNKWQLHYFEEFLKNPKNETAPIFQDSEAHIFRGFRYQPIQLIHKGHLILKKGKIIIEFNGKILQEFDIQKIEGINVQNKEKLEFYYSDKLYRIHFSSMRVSSYKWLVAVLLLKQFNPKSHKMGTYNIKSIFRT